MDDLNYFLPGQVWQYDTRSGEENSTLTVLAIEEGEYYAIIHVRIENINFINDGCLPHLAFSADAVMASVTDFVKHLDAVPDFKEGYTHWKQAFEDRKAGYWRITVKEAVEAIEQVMRKK
ncbi:MAG TPA: hypothetical protein VK489_15625 [Ferruginibacter sp.]|nr:hypothetical protein [Ferruginibacter sp.]